MIRCTGCDGKYHTFPSFYTHRSLMKKKGFNHEMIKEWFSSSGEEKGVIKY